MKYIRTNSLKRLFSLKWRSLEEATSPNGSKGVENNEILKNVEAKELSPRPTWKCFSYEEISDATNAFSSEVYRGVLKNGEEIAVKRLTKAMTDERKDKEFLNEIGTIGHVESFKFSTPIFCRSFISLLLNITQVHHSSSARSVVQIPNSNLLQLNLERLQVLNSFVQNSDGVHFIPIRYNPSQRPHHLLHFLVFPFIVAAVAATNARRLFK